MKYHVLTLFPEMIEYVMGTSIIGRAVNSGLIDFETVNIRDYAPAERKRRVDDYPYGGGAGMVMQPEPVFGAWQKVCDELGRKPRTIYLSPQGKTFDQKMAHEFAQEEDLVFLCGHYEGIDERVLDEIVTDQVSIGDYVLTGGELPSLVMMDTISRLVPGVLTNEDSGLSETFEGDLLEYPQYTRPAVWHEKEVPAILLSGDHGKVDRWRRDQSIERTLLHRPDLLAKAEETFDKKDRKFLRELKTNLANQEET